MIKHVARDLNPRHTYLCWVLSCIGMPQIQSLVARSLSAQQLLRLLKVVVVFNDIMNYDVLEVNSHEHH